MNECSYNYVKPRYGENVKLCYMDIDSFIVHVKTDDVCKDFAEDVETRFEKVEKLVTNLHDET